MCIVINDTRGKRNRFVLTIKNYLLNLRKSVDGRCCTCLLDKPNIRFVIHACLLSSVEAFYQEIGRAARDGNASETILFYNLQDIIKRRQ